MNKILAMLLIVSSALSFASPQSNQQSTYTKISEDGDLLISKTSKNVFVIAGPILNGLAEGADLGPIAFSMKRAVDKKEEVLLVINSPGGLVDEVTLDFLATMDRFKEDGISITCVVNGMAASLAAIIYSKCTNRYATPSARILWHSVATGHYGKINEQISKRYYDEFHAMNEKFWAETRAYFSDDYFKKHFDAEDFVLAIDLEKEGDKYLKVVRYVLLSE